MTSTIIYTKIKESVLSNLNVKSFGLWNNQVNKDKAGSINPIKYPYVGIQFENEYSDLSSGYQQINGNFVLYICIQSLQHKDEDILNFKDSVYQTLSSQLPSKGFQNFSRAFEVQDTDRDNLIVWNQEYAYTYIDDTGKDVHNSLSGWTFSNSVTLSPSGYTSTNIQGSI